MAILTTTAELKDWTGYREFLKAQLKLLADGEQPLYVSKDKLEFDIEGSTWKGHAVLLGPKAKQVRLKLKGDGLVFREGLCRKEARRLSPEGLAPKLVKELERTLTKLKLGYEVAGVPAQGGAGAAAAGEREAWEQLKRELTPRVRSVLSGDGESQAELAGLVSRAMQREKAGDFAGAVAFFEQAAPLLKPRARGSTPSRGKKKKGPKKDLVGQVIEDVVGDPKERMQALAKYKVPLHSDEYANDTDEIRFLHDLDSGTKKAQAYVTYVEDAFEYYEKYGEHVGLGELNSVQKGLQKITGRFASGLKKVGRRIEGAKNLTRWIGAIDAFAKASGRFKAGDRESAKLWVGSVKQLADATAPYVQWAQSKAFQGAFAGSKAASIASMAIGLVAVQFYGGVKALDQGLKNVDAYLDRLDKWTKMADEAEGNARPKPPPPPAQPGEWKTREELEQAAVWRENYLLEQKLRAEYAQKVRDAAAKFDREVFPKLYLKARGGIRSKVLRAVRRSGKETYQVGGPQEMDWWKCFTRDDAAANRNAQREQDDGESPRGPHFDREAGVSIYPTKAKVSGVEARSEIDNFRRLKGNPCPYFQQLYDAGRKTFVKKAV